MTSFSVDAEKLKKMKGKQMSDQSRVVVPLSAGAVLIVGMGGDSRTRAAWVDGQRSDRPVQRDGADLYRLSGVAVSIGGRGLDGATVETLTPLENVAAGTVFRAEGAVELAVRAVGRAGFRATDSPRGVLEAAVYVERLVPAGTLDALLKAAPAPDGPKRAGAAAS